MHVHSIAERTAGYSGSDIVLLCKEAAMRPVRKLMKRLARLPSSSSSSSSPSRSSRHNGYNTGGYHGSTGDGDGGLFGENGDLSPDIKLSLVSMSDIEAALRCIKPSQVCMYECVNVWMCVHIHVYMYVCAWTRFFLIPTVFVFHRFVRAFVCKCIHITQPCVYTLHAQIRLHDNVFMHTLTHVHTHTRTPA